MELYELKAVTAARKMAAGEISSAELTGSVLRRIEARDGQVKAYLHVDAESALRQARAYDKKAAENGALIGGGLPTAVKDNICLEGMPTTCASKILAGFQPVYQAGVVERLLDNQVVVVGKTNLDEFAMGSSTENSAFKTTANPWDLSRVPGGSSGGSAAAVAGGEALWALGSDTGGSIRQPAAFCGVVGMKPTYGLVSRYGLVAFASSLDQIGPIARDVRDAAALLQIIVGHDPRDSTSLNYRPPDYQESLNGELKGLRVGVPKELMQPDFSPGVRAGVENALKIWSKLGAEIEETSLPMLEYALAAYYLIAPAEASANLARFDGVRYGFRSAEKGDIMEMYRRTRSQGFGPEVKRRIMLGTYALSAGYYDAYYGQAQKVRGLIIKDFQRALTTYDVLAAPTTPTTAFKIGAKTADPLQMYLSDICTIPMNLAGLPAISVPGGMEGELPVGVQVIGNYFDESKILLAAYALEQELDFQLKPLKK